MTLQLSILWREEIGSALPELAASQDMYIDPEGPHLLCCLDRTELMFAKMHSENS